MNIFSSLLQKKLQIEFVEDADGLHIFGGGIPDDFNIPKNNFLANFQYIGKISKADKNFNWLPFDINLICPILTDFDFLFLDYENALSPTIIYPENTESVTSAYEEINQETRMTYEMKKFGLRRFRGINEDNEFEIFGIAGKPQPNFDDEPIIFPICPKTNKKMKFVAQLFSNKHLKTISKNFKSKSDYEENIHQHMNFWCDGSLKIFMEPSSNIVCYCIQNT